MKKYIAILLTLLLLLAGCGAKTEPAQTAAPAETSVPTETAEAPAETTATEAVPAVTLPDGVYTAAFDTDSSMFHANEACEGRGTLTVKDGKMSLHVSLVSKSILNLYPGLAEDAQKEGAAILEHTLDEVVYADGYKDTVFGFDIPVPVLNEEFDLALIGKKGIWYDHKVSVSDPQPLDTLAELEDGSYTCDVTSEGGTGKNTVLSPCTLTVADGKATAVITWTSTSLDYMLVEGEKLLPVGTEGGTSFEIPVASLDIPMSVTVDTLAMSTPHEVEYVLYFNAATVTALQ